MSEVISVNVGPQGQVYCKVQGDAAPLLSGCWTLESYSLIGASEKYSVWQLAEAAVSK